MKPTDPTPEEYVKWIMDNTCEDIWFEHAKKKVVEFVLTELRDNSTTEINRLYFNECLKELEKL